ncbi:hypothetical protein C8J57DRAFT_573884 [Mycena rebaudengoi]|nr:hypothetical protein C8J57DRAFT_573884 [Mycena rebaudengoi]
MSSTLRSPAKASQFSKLQRALQVKLGLSSHDSDSDLESPSPLSICFDLSKGAATSPLYKSSLTIWTDSDSDSDSEPSPTGWDDAQYITISPDSPFYIAPATPSFRATFDLAEESQCISIPADSPFHSAPPPPSFRSSFDILPLGHEDPSHADQETVADLFYAEIERVMPCELRESVFVLDAEGLKGIDSEFYSAPMDAFMDVCLAGLRPASALTVDATRSDVDLAPPAPSYYLVSFQDLQQHRVAKLHPTLCGLFTRHIRHS